MSGAILPNITYAAQNSPLYAPIGGGGGGGSNITASTITMSGPILMDNNTISLSTGGQSQLYYNSMNQNTYLIGVSSPTESVHIGTQSNANALIVNDGGIGVNGNQFITGQLSVSTIVNVSTINGSPFPPSIDTYADHIPVSDYFAGGPSTIAAATQAALSSSFSVVSGHTYRFTTTKVQFSNTDTATNQQVGVSGTGQTPFPICQTVSGLLTNSGNDFAATQYVCTWRQQSAGPCQIVAFNNSLTQPSLVTMDSLIGMPHLVEDLGPLI